MKPARILILTNGPLARNPRVVKEASTLGQAGYTVKVLGVRNHAASVSLDAAITRNAPYAHQQIDLLSGPAAWLRRALIRCARDLARRGGPATIHALGPAGALLRAARRETADLVIGHNEIAHWSVAHLLKSGRRCAADFEDWHSEDLLPADRIGRPMKRLRQLERTLLHEASYASTTSHALAAALHERYAGRPPDVITNSFPLPPLVQRNANRGQPPSFFWFSQTTGPGRGLEPFLSAYGQVAVPSRLVLLGTVCAGYDRHLLSLLPDSHRARVSFLPLVPPAELPDVISRHDIGLALEQPFIASRDLTITNKILQYLGSGLAVVASDTAGQREVFAHDPSIGVIMPLHETAALAAALERLLANPGELHARQTAALRLAADRYCWEREAPHLISCVKHALS